MEFGENKNSKSTSGKVTTFWKVGGRRFDLGEPKLQSGQQAGSLLTEIPQEL